MAEPIGSGHGPKGKYGKYRDVHIKITLMCTVRKGKVSEWWWSVTPAGAQLKRKKKGVIHWELCAYDSQTGDPLNCSIKKVQMAEGWKKKWGEPKKDPTHSNNRHWILRVNVPGGVDLQRHEYTVSARVPGLTIPIDPEVDFEPGDE